ncbi:hypothetical protein [Micromonospora maritima]|uniref:Uncharacterized protein n=1 Tax=Micromonospora maritima TaxID=986711 RepID=A0ABW7ZSP4_9ACTN
MTYGIEYVATVGPEQTAWLTNPEHFDGSSAGAENGDGTVTLTEEHRRSPRRRRSPRLSWQPGFHGTGTTSPHLPPVCAG